MTEGEKIAITAGLTAIGGVVVFVIGQIVQKWFIDPIQEQRKLVGDIVYSIIEHSNLFNYSASFKSTARARYEAKGLEGKEIEHIDEAYQAVKEKTAEGVKKLRNLSSQIHQSIQVIPCYWLLERLGVVHKREKLYEVAIKLIEWATEPNMETTLRSQDAIVHLLKVKHLIKAAKEREKQIAKT
jgi:5-bromo-4-chloroindolyl phosphate hydrolysis protein